MEIVVPFTLITIFVLLFFIFRKVGDALLVMGTLPFALIGGFWLLYLLGFNLSVAVDVCFIALAGVTAEFGVVMLVYINQVVECYQAENRLKNNDDLKNAIMEGAILRVLH